jgi:hypothetical protein
MIRSVALALSALVLVSTPAAASEMIVKLTGKSAEQVRTDIVKAASTVCWKDVRSESLAMYLYPACVRASVATAVAQLNDPAVTSYNLANPAATQLASR